MTIAQVPRTNTFALVGFIACFMIPVVGIVLGVMAQKQIAVTGEGGQGLAKAAVIVGAVGTALLVLFYVVWFAFFIVWVSLFSAAVAHNGLIG